MDWVDFITKIGFPGGVAVMLMFWTAKRIEKTEDHAAKREGLMGSRINQLEDKIEVELTEMIRGQGKLVSEAMHVMGGCTTALQTCTAVLERLKASSPAIKIEDDSEIIVQKRKPSSSNNVHDE